LKIFSFISDFAIPFVMIYLVGYGIWVKCPIYDAFVKGAINGMKTVVNILPTLVGLMVAVSILRTSGFLDDFCTLLKPIANLVHLPTEIFPLVFIKMFSSSAATSLLIDIFKQNGTDSYLGFCGALICSSTETIFYTMSVYFIHAKVQKTRWTLVGALFASFAGVIASIFLANFY
jgi:spore maturation protein B